MKVGDLVTLSQYGMNLGTIPHKYTRWWSPDSPDLFGIVTEVRQVKNPHGHLSNNEQKKYVVNWNVEDLRGRTYYGGYFYRNDLKFFR